MTETFWGILIPFFGYIAGRSVCVFMQRALGDLVQRSLAGFAAGVMVAASVWSLLIPAIEQSEGLGRFAFFPAFAGFWFGVLFLLALDHLIPHLHVGSEELRAKSRLAAATMMVLAVTCTISRRHGSRCDVCRFSQATRRSPRRARWLCPSHSHTEFPGGRYHLDAPACRRGEQGQGLCRRCTFGRS